MTPVFPDAVCALTGTTCARRRRASPTKMILLDASLSKLLHLPDQIHYKVDVNRDYVSRGLRQLLNISQKLNIFATTAPLQCKLQTRVNCLSKRRRKRRLS